MGTILVGLYIGCELIANVTASKPIRLGSIVVPAAIFIYALTFTLIDLVNESFGKKGARKVIAAAFLANVLLAAYTQLAIALPPAHFYQGQEAFSRVLGSTPRIVLASLTAYAISSLIDTEIFAQCRARVRGPRWLRVLLSNAISTGVDSAVFVSLAFYGVMPVWTLMKGQYLLKMAITVVSLPLIYLIHGQRKTKEFGMRNAECGMDDLQDNHSAKS